MDKLLPLDKLGLLLERLVDFLFDTIRVLGSGGGPVFVEIFREPCVFRFSGQGVRGMRMRRD